MLNNVISIFESGAAAAGAGSYESIATVTVGAGGASSITFSSIPTTGYAHLQIRGIARLNLANEITATLTLQFNSDTGSNYSRHVLYGEGSTPLAFGEANSTNASFILGTGNNAIANNFGPFVVDILDYANTNKYKTLRAINGVSNNGSSADEQARFMSGSWRNTNAITSIKIERSGNTIQQYSHFALYGIKGA